MAQGKKGAGASRRKPAKRRKAPRRAKATRRKAAKRGAAKVKPRKQGAKVQRKRTTAKTARARKAVPRKRQREPEINVIEVETIEEVAPGVALVTDYELIGVREPAAEVQTEGARKSRGVN